MSSLITTAVTGAAMSGAYTGIFQVFVVITLLVMLTAVELAVGVSNIALRQMSRAAALLTVPMLVAFLAIVVEHVISAANS